MESQPLLLPGATPESSHSRCQVFRADFSLLLPTLRAPQGGYVRPFADGSFDKPSIYSYNSFRKGRSPLDNISNCASQQNCQLCVLIIALVEKYKAKHRGNTKIGNVKMEYICELDWNGLGTIELRGDGDKKYSLFYLSYAVVSIESDSILRGYTDFQLQVSPSIPFDSPVATMVGRFRPQRCNPSLLESWVNVCRTSHKKCSSPVSMRIEAKHSIRLIDVKQLCIKHFHHSSEIPSFIALSYVWGKDPQKIVLTEANKDQLEKDEALKDLPKTISDAIRLVRDLNERWLWVDSLCIIQDNEKEIEIHIPAMSNIYSSALLTIVAGFGDSVHAGLPGIQSDREEQLTATVGGVKLLTRANDLSPRFGGPLYSTVWNTRAWTFQEQLLSRRRLTFLDDQAYWQCNESEWIEDMDLDGLNQHISWDIGLHRKLELNVDQYDDLVKEYTERHLTCDADIYKAFGGILAAIPDYFLCATPSTQFVEHLCWRSGSLSDSLLLKRRLKPSVPSWSWLGWKGHIEMERDVDEKPVPLISCHHLKEGSLQCVNQAQQRPEVTLSQVPSEITLNDRYIVFWAELVRLRVQRHHKGRRMYLYSCDENTGVDHHDVGVLLADTENVIEDNSIHDFVFLAELDDIYLVLMLSWHTGIARRECMGQIWYSSYRKLKKKRTLVVLE